MLLKFHAPQYAPSARARCIIELYVSGLLWATAELRRAISHQDVCRIGNRKGERFMRGLDYKAGQPATFTLDTTQQTFSVLNVISLLNKRIPVSGSVRGSRGYQL